VLHRAGQSRLSHRETAQEKDQAMCRKIFGEGNLPFRAVSKRDGARIPDMEQRIVNVRRRNSSRVLDDAG
jgi:hypothetical protein